MINTALAKKINIACLVLAMIAVMVLPLKKEIWYDESISILCSKGINSDAATAFANTTTLSSATIEQLNTAQNVFKATVLDDSREQYRSVYAIFEIMRDCCFAGVFCTVPVVFKG